MAQIEINQIKMQVSEERLIGMFCAIINTHGLTPEHDISVIRTMDSKNTEYLKNFENKFTMKHNYKQILELCNNLQQSTESDCSYVELFSKNDSEKGYKYYISEDISEEFTKGYFWYKRYNELFEGSGTKISEIDHYVSESTLVRTPGTKSNIDPKYEMALKVPAYLWDIPKIDHIPEKILVSYLIALFLRDCSLIDYKKLENNKTYLRFMMYQDSDTESDPYVYAYIRDIDNCTFSSHKNILLSCPVDKLPCEVNLGISRGFFYMFPIDEWNNKSVMSIIRLD